MRIDELKEKVSVLYHAKNKTRAQWADWLFVNHIFVVADYAEELSVQHGAKKELAMAAGMLHDIADANTSRFDAQHAEKSKKIGGELLQQTGFSEEEIKIIVDDAIELHSCRDGKTPKTLEGKIMATADALAHLKTDFYEYAFEAMQKEKTNEEMKAWALPKIERDFQNKIFFEDVREEVRPNYLYLKEFFESLP